MSCCQRPAVPQPPRWRSAAPVPTAPALPAEAPTGPALRFDGQHPLSLPLGTRRVMVTPGQTVAGLSPAERDRLWRTGLFSKV